MRLFLYPLSTGTVLIKGIIFYEAALKGYI